MADPITVSIAVYAAVVSTGTGAWNVYTWRKQNTLTLHVRAYRFHSAGVMEVRVINPTIHDQRVVRIEGIRPQRPLAEKFRLVTIEPALPRVIPKYDGEDFKIRYEGDAALQVRVETGDGRAIYVGVLDGF